jgi:hypothetical protein
MSPSLIPLIFLVFNGPTFNILNIIMAASELSLLPFVVYSNEDSSPDAFTARRHNMHCIVNVHHS